MSRFGFGGSISFQRQHNHRAVPRDLLREKGAAMQSSGLPPLTGPMTS
jgi:hypothetical protein